MVLEELILENYNPDSDSSKENASLSMKVETNGVCSQRKACVEDGGGQGGMPTGREMGAVRVFLFCPILVRILF